MQAPKLPTIFKQQGSRGFEFKPRYYDERKERLEELKRQYSGDPAMRNPEILRDRLSAKWRAGRQGKVRSSNFRLFGIIAILTFVAYLIINN